MSPCLDRHGHTAAPRSSVGRRALRRTVAVVVLWGCGGSGTGPSSPPDAQSLELAVPIPSLEVGQTTTVAAFRVNAAGARSELTHVTWSVSPAAVASISSFGLLTALSEGVAVITATTGGIQGSVHLPIVPVAVARVDLSPATPDVGPGEDLQLVAVLRDRSGRVLTGRAITWSSSDSTRATVSATGAVHTISPGTVTIRATSDGVQGQVLVTVRDRVTGVQDVAIDGSNTLMVVGDTLRLSATVRDGTGRILSDRTVTWAVSVTSGRTVASVSGDGLVRALSQGSAVIEATCEGRTALLPIKVVDNLDTSIVVSLAAPVVSDTVSDTLLVMADVKHVHPLAQVVASVGPLNVVLKLTPVGRGTLLWAGKLILSDLRVGTYIVQVDATDSRGALGRATRAFVRKYRAGDGGTPPGPRSK